MGGALVWAGLLALLVGALSAAPLASLARRWGLVDPPPARAVPARKQGQSPVAVSGGISVLLGIGAGAALLAALGGPVPKVFGAAPAWCFGALAAAFLAGAWDDRRDLGPLGKLAAELPAALFGALALFQAGILADHGPLALGVLALWVLAVLQVVNTYDHADGFCASLCGTALLLPAPWLGASALGWLPFNANRRGGRGPTAFLGDSGSHLLAVAVALTPPAWPGLWIAALDLACVLWARAAAGAPLWRGDRRHLGQRLADAGLSPRARLAAQWLAALPAVVCGWAGGPWLLGGLVLTSLGYGVLRRWAGARR